MLLGVSPRSSTIPGKLLASQQNMTCCQKKKKGCKTYVALLGILGGALGVK